MALNPVDQQVQTLINQQTAPVKAEQATSDQQAQAQQTNITGLSKALADILGGIAPGIQQTYSDAAQAQSGFAKGFSDQMQAHLNGNASSTSDFLTNIVGAPSSQVAQVAGQVAPAGAADTLYGLRGYIPASTLNEEGAGFTAAAKMLPGEAYSQGLAQIGKVQAAQRAADAGFATEIQKIAATAPQLHAQIVKDIADAKYKEASIALRKAGLQLSADRLRLSAQNQQFNQKLGIAKYNTGVSEFNARQSYNYAKMARQAYQSDRSYGLQLAGLGIRQKSLQLRVMAQEAKLQGGGFSNTQVLKFTSTATTLADNAFHGVRLTDKYGNLIDRKGKTLSATDTPVYAHPPLTYNQAIRESRKEGIPLSIAQAELNKVYKPGQGGRPYTEQTAPPIYGPTMGQAGKSNSVVNAASRFIGTPYVWGGTTPGKALDCSGFTQASYAAIGIHIPRTTYDQVKAGRGVSLNQLQPGDLVFTEPGKNGPNHVGMYIGNGQVQESPHTGDVNKVIPLKSFLSGGFVAARRYIG